MRSLETKKLIALTFDDGPVEPYTTQILEILRKQEIKATFFVIGSNVRRNPEIARNILQQGHVIGNHTQTHNAWLLLLSPRSFIKDILECQEVVEKTVGVVPVLFRPCNGLGLGISRFVPKYKLIPVGWDVSSQDWRKSTPSEIADRVLMGIKPGAIVLFHDGYIPGKPRSADATIQSLPALIEGLKKSNYNFVTVPELLGISPYHGIL